MAIYKDKLETCDYTGDGKPIPIAVYLVIDTEEVVGAPFRDLITKVVYGNISMSFADFEKGDLGGSQEIMADIEKYVVDNYYRS